MQVYRQRDKTGFTLVELLIVIVVIAILAAISVVAFNGIQDRAVTTMLKSDLAGSARVLEADKVVQGAYPVSDDLANDGRGLPASKGVVYQYTADNTGTPSYCLTGSYGKHSYYISSTNTSVTNEGFCAGHEDPNAVPEILEVVKGTHLAAETGTYNITTDLRPSDLVFILLRKSPSGTAWMNVYGEVRTPIYSNSVPVGSTPKTIAYAVTGLTGPGVVESTQASTSFDNHVTIYVLRGVRSPTSITPHEYVSTWVTPAGQYSTPAVTIDKKQVAIFARMTLNSSTQPAIAFTPTSGWSVDNTTQLSTYNQIHTAHYVPDGSTEVQGTTTLTSSGYILQVMFVIGAL